MKGVWSKLSDPPTFATGLAELNTEELQQMRDEMASKFTRLSDTLIIELQQRDVFIQQMAAKNRFVSALLKVQGMKHSMGVSGSVDGARGSRPWTQLAWAGKGKEEKNSGKVCYMEFCSLILNWVG